MPRRDEQQLPPRRPACFGEVAQGPVEDAVAKADADPDVRVVVLVGAGDKAFVSGADISQFEKTRHNAKASEEYAKRSEAQRALLANYPKPTIAFKDFDKRYYPVFINDIAAARAYLDRKNDNRECNTSNFILIGAQEGATLGALWMHSEYYRYRIIEEAAGLARVERLDKTPEGKDIICLVALSMSSKLGDRYIRLSSVLHNADGTTRGFVALAVDVTERKKLDEQIRQSQKVESSGLLAGGIAHDFTNLLTGMIGNASLIADLVPDEVRGRVKEVIKAGDRAANLTGQLLAYA